MMSGERRSRGIVAGLLVGGLIAVVALSVSGVSDAASSLAGAKGSSGPTSMSELPRMLPFQQASFYPVLAQPMTAQDEGLVASAEAMAASGAKEEEPIVMEPDQVRKVGSAGGLTIGIMPSDKGLCILASPAPGEVTGSCSPEESLELAGLNVGFTRGDRYFEIGVLPRGWSGEVSAATEEGARDSMKANADGFYASVTTEPVVEVKATDAEGVARPIVRQGDGESPLAVRGG